jgi:hypothetical protein
MVFMMILALYLTIAFLAVKSIIAIKIIIAKRAVNKVNDQAEGPADNKK